MKKTLALLLVFFLFIPTAFAAIAVDATSVGSTFPAGDNTTLTVSHTVTGTNTMLITHLYGPLDDVLTSVTYNGDAMTLIDKRKDSDRWNYLLYLVNPDTGTNNIVVTLGSAQFMTLESASYTDVAQEAPEASNTGFTDVDTDTSLTVAVTTITDNAWLVGGGSWSAGGIGAGTNTFLRQNNGGVNTGDAYFDSNAAQTPAGAHSLQITGTILGASTAGAFVVAAIAPFVEPPPVSTPPPQDVLFFN